MPRIDVHHHFVPSLFKTYAEKQNEWPSPPWTVDSDREFCHDHDIKISILSLTSPGTGVGGTLKSAIEIARDSNITAAKARDEYPKQYGFFASIPPPVGKNGLAAALEELNYAFDELKADGVTLLTSYSGSYLGHAEFAPLWDELNRRKAVVFIHPTSPQGCKPTNQHLLAPLADFAWETTRTGLDLILSNTLREHANECKIILSHAGGCLPWIWQRPAVLLPGLAPGSGKSTEEFQEDAKSFNFDTALSGNKDVIDLLIKFAGSGHVLFGSDFPYADWNLITTFTKGLDEMEMSDEAREKINWRNGLDLFLRFEDSFKFRSWLAIDWRFQCICDLMTRESSSKK